MRCTPSLVAHALLGATLLGQDAPPALPAPLPDEPIADAWAWLAQAPGREVGDAPQSPGVAAIINASQRTRVRASQLVEIAIAARIESQLSLLPLDERIAIIETLAPHTEPVFELALLLHRDDDHAQAYRLLARLAEAYPEQIDDLAPLAAAICVVHDQPKSRRVNEHTIGLIDPIDLFGYLADHQRSLHIDPTSAPASMLTFVADANGTIEELVWARSKYRRDRDIGARYHEIEYDYSGLTGTKRVTASGEYSLQAIKTHGGICADQAYFAMSVGKANGVPGAYVRGKGGDVSHAWLGFVERTGRRGLGWNFDSGRFDVYEDVRGTVLEPQTWSWVPDANLAIAGYASWIKPEDRRHSTALTDLAEITGMQSDADDPGDVLGARLELLEQAIKLNPGNLRAWLNARRLLALPLIDFNTRERWSREVDLLASNTSPDFAFDMFQAIFDAVEDPEVRYRLWDWAATKFGRRQDLPALARLTQARLLVDADKPEAAFEIAKDAFEQYHQGGSAAMDALTLAETVLADANKHDAVLELYDWAWKQTPTPRRAMSVVFASQSNWFKVGTRYADLLEAGGETRRAGTVRAQIGRKVASVPAP